MMSNKLIILTCAILMNSTKFHAQCSGWNNLQSLDSVFTNPALGISTTTEIDRLNRPFTYLATVSGGVRVYNTNASGNHTLVATVPKSALGNLDAINLYQDSIWLYVCLGNIWNTSEMAGLAILDVSNPANPNLLDFYVHNGLPGGAGSVITKGNYAYLAANQNGLVILNISNKSNIQLTSSLTFSNNYPHTTTGSNTMYNARGIALKDNYAIVCYDRGGLRIVDISNINSPVQINQYCYSALINKTTAYNNIVIHNNLAYVAIDYYGMEILDISNPNNITQIAWWHPNNWAAATTDFNSWANSPGHANEISYDPLCKKVYLAAGKSDAVAIDVSTPANPVTCEIVGSTTDSYGTWGLDYFNGKISVAYIWSVAFPPYSNYTGFKTLKTNCMTAGLNENFKSTELSIWPNPADNILNIGAEGIEIISVKIYTIAGILVQEDFTNLVSIQNLPDGMYYAAIQTSNSKYISKVIKK